VTVEIVGARPGNPRRLLSERAAGVIPDYDVVTGSGTAVLLDRASQLIRVIRLGDASAPVVTAAYKLTTNRPYLLEVRSRDASDVLRVDGHELLEFATLTGGLRQLALVVEDAEAVFRLPEA
jgi:hypothetical protein